MTPDLSTISHARAAVVERLLKALREARPGKVRHFFSLASQHVRWELNDLALRLAKGSLAVELNAGQVLCLLAAIPGSLPPVGRILDAIQNLPEGEREAIDLARIQGMTQAEAAQVLDVSAMTVNRRLNRSPLLLTEALGDLRPDENASNS